MKPDLDMLGMCASRYGVSLVALALRWLEITERRALVVVSRDGFLLWSRSSERALRTGMYFRTSGAPVAVPDGSCLSSGLPASEARKGIRHEGKIWFDEPVEEQTVRSDTYNFVLTLLHLDQEERGRVGWRSADGLDR